MIGEENFFIIEPEEGIFKANEEITFNITFKPINSIIYEQKLELFIEDIPFQAIKQFDFEANQNMKTTVSKVEPYLPGFNSSLPSYPLYSFSLRGRGKLPFLSVNKNIIDLGDVYIGQHVEDNFSVSCEQSGFVGFKITKIFQQILKGKDEDNHVENFFKNPCLENSIIFKDKLPMNNNIGEEEPIQGLFTENEERSNLASKEVNYIEIYTNKNNLAEKKSSKYPRRINCSRFCRIKKCPLNDFSSSCALIHARCFLCIIFTKASAGFSFPSGISFIFSKYFTILLTQTYPSKYSESIASIFFLSRALLLPVAINF